MPVAQIIAILTDLIARGLATWPMVQSWIADRSYLEALQAEHGPDYVPVDADFAGYTARLDAAEAAIHANADRARQGR
jgi:hypothetical protein